FHGLPKLKQVVLHKDNNRNNNTPNNLMWGTQSENILQVYKDGLKYSRKYSVSQESEPHWMSWSNENYQPTTEDFDYVSVNSSNIYNVGYDRKEKTLEVEFKSGSVYQYSSVPKEVFEELVHAFSVGQYFQQNIRDQYGYNRIT